MNRETEFRLRARLAKAEREARCQRRRADKATAEAAVLRIESSRLVRAMAYCLRDDSDCDRCLMNGCEEEHAVPSTLACDGLQGRLEAFGVKVGEGC